MPRFVLDQSLEELARDIIDKRRTYLKAVKIAYMFRPEATVSNGRTVAGMCIRVDDRNRAVSGLDFIVEIAKDVWEDATTPFRRALMDHELGHCGIRMNEQGQPERSEQTDRIKTYIKPHDIEEFADVLEEHGPYHAKLREFLQKFAKNKEKKEAEKVKAAATP